MTLNLCKRPIFSGNPFEEIFVSRGNDRYQPQYLTWDGENTFDYALGTNDGEISREPLANDILDFLPLDPFDMGMSSTFATMTGWMEDLEPDELKVLMGKEVMFLDELMIMSNYEGSNPFDGSSGRVEKHGNEVGNGGLVLNGSDGCTDCSGESQMGSVCCDENGGEPHDAMFFAFRFLSVQDLLSVKSVCRSFCSEVENNCLLWRNIQINYPLNERITDDALLKLTDMAEGHLQSLSLVDCFKITEDALKCVLERNPRLTKLNVSGCTRLGLDSIVTNLKAFKSSATLGIKHLRIGERYGITQEHFEELKSLIGVEACLNPETNPRFYHIVHSSLSWDDDCALDIEMCPRCKNVGLVYDCPAESCQGLQSGKQPCRTCSICIPRCIECGRCINDNEYEETFLLDLLCVNC